MIFTKKYKAVNWEYNLKVYISLKLSIYLIDIINDKTHYLKNVNLNAVPRMNRSYTTVNLVHLFFKKYNCQSTSSSLKCPKLSYLLATNVQNKTNGIF